MIYNASRKRRMLGLLRVSMSLSQDKRNICQECDPCITSEPMTSWLMGNKGDVFQSLITHAIFNRVFSNTVVKVENVLTQKLYMKFSVDS